MLRPASGFSSRKTERRPPVDSSRSASRTSPLSMRSFVYLTIEEGLSRRVSATLPRVSRRMVQERAQDGVHPLALDSRTHVDHAEHHRQPLRAPAETPLMKSLCMSHMMRSTGTITTHPIAAIGPHTSALSVMNPAMSTVSGLARTMVRMTA